MRYVTPNDKWKYWRSLRTISNNAGFKFATKSHNDLMIKQYGIELMFNDIGFMVNQYKVVDEAAYLIWLLKYA